MLHYLIEIIGEFWYVSDNASNFDTDESRRKKREEDLDEIVNRQSASDGDDVQIVGELPQESPLSK